MWKLITLCLLAGFQNVYRLDLYERFTKGTSARWQELRTHHLITIFRYQVSNKPLVVRKPVLV